MADSNENMTDIDERVTSENITEISKKSALSATFNKYAAPKYEELKEKITSDLDKKIAAVSKGSNEYERLTALKTEFDQVMSEELPEGFKLIPVLINPKLSNEDIRQTYKEFTSHVKTDFIKYIAETSADELKQHGASEHIISLMKTGYIDEDIFPYNVDHILERGNSCVYSLEKSMDPNNPRATDPSFKVNHFNNMILIPKSIHDLKNLIKKIQVEIYDDDQAKYLLMLTPEEEPNKHGLVCRAQPVNSKYGMKPLTNHASILKTIGRLSKETKNEIVGSPHGRQSLRDITREIRIKLEGSEKSSNKRVANRCELEEIFENESFKALVKKLQPYQHTEIDNFKKAVEEAKKFINPDKNKKINRIFRFSL